MYAASRQIIIALWQCVWFPALNVRRAKDEDGNVLDKPRVLSADDPKIKVLIASLEDRGYDPQYPVVVGPITKEQIAQAALERTEQYKVLQTISKNQPSNANSARLSAFEYFYTKPAKKGAERIILAPEFLGCTGNCRSFSVFEAAVLRILRDLTTNKDIFSDPSKSLAGLDMYALYEEFKDTDELSAAEARRIRQIAENEAKTEGFSPLDIMEALFALKGDVETGRVKQARIREIYPTGTAQKIHGFLTLNGRFPKLEMLKRLTLPQANERFLPWGKMPQGEKGGFPETVTRSSQLLLDDHNQKVRKTGKGEEWTFLDQFGVEGKLQEWKNKGGTNEKKIMEKDAMRSIQGANPSKVVQNVLEDVLLNVKVKIDRYTAAASFLNECDDMIGTPLAADAETLMTLINSAVTESEVDGKVVKDYTAASGLLAGLVNTAKAEMKTATEKKAKAEAKAK